ncbi:hypothetical protein A6R68_19002 [Neotoma lepida]|uniref:Uncharacterized protein n=1 Tax=Neotoma lepida TaxID=56216 RepID=A0A1A6HK60_NEOLE|nr:hypothetical protein A6R68_19002 [Neotoma lepida]
MRGRIWEAESIKPKLFKPLLHVPKQEPACPFEFLHPPIPAVFIPGSVMLHLTMLETFLQKQL